MRSIHIDPEHNMLTRPNDWPADGSLPPHVTEFVEWLITPTWEREPQTQKQWALDHGYADGHQTSVWKRDARVKRALEKRCDELNLSVDRVQEVINSVFKAATQGDMKAATLYLQHADRLAPRRIVIEDRTLSSMTDDELREQLIAAGLGKED